MDPAERHDPPPRRDPALRRVLECAGIAVATLDTEGRVVTATTAFAERLGAEVDPCGAHLVSLYPDPEQPEVMATLVRVLERPEDAAHHDMDRSGTAGAGRLRTTVCAVEDGGGRVVELAVALVDASEGQRTERRRRRRVVELTRAATRDPATGLPNSLGFDSLLGTALRRSARVGHPFAVLHLELEGLSARLEELDVAAADALVADYAARLAERLRPSDEVTRGPGDSFMVIAEDLGDAQDAAGVAYRLLSTVVEPLEVAGHPVELALTIGVVVADGTAHPDTLAATARRALDEAREGGSGGFRIIDVRPGLAA